MPKYALKVRVRRKFILASNINIALKDLQDNIHNYLDIRIEECTSIHPESFSSQPDLYMECPFNLFH